MRAVDLKATYTFTSTEILAVDNSPEAPPPYAVGDPLLRRPRNQGSARPIVSDSRWSAFAQLMVRGETLDAEPAFGPTGGLYSNDGYARDQPRRLVAADAVACRCRAACSTCSIRRTKRSSATRARAAPPMSESVLLQADNVTFRYHAGAPLVVDGVTLAIERGDLVGLLGPNGSGKTTLLRLLSGTRAPSSGTVRLGGQPLASQSRRDIARRLAVVPQETELAFEYTALEIVLMGRHPHLGLFQVEGPGDYAIAREALAATGTVASRST